MGDTRARVLFLDDMQARHTAFRDASARFSCVVDYVWSADEAIQALKDRPYDQVFLDHDLSEDDIMRPVGASTKVPTGMKVVDFICLMERRPTEVFLHTCNGPAAEEMKRRLRDVGHVQVQVIPFPALVAGMLRSGG